MPHTIINYTNEHSWAGFKSTICSPIKLQRNCVWLILSLTQH